MISNKCQVLSVKGESLLSLLGLLGCLGSLGLLSEGVWRREIMGTVFNKHSLSNMLEDIYWKGGGG